MFTLEGPLGKDLGQVEMRWALASLGSLSRFEPVGFWIDTEWAEIRKELESRMDYEKLEVLFSDGGPGIGRESFASRHETIVLSVAWQEGVSHFLYADGFKKASNTRW